MKVGAYMERLRVIIAGDDTMMLAMVTVMTANLIMVTYVMAYMYCFF